jgi:ketosteroid isomerase-like protein
MSEENMDMVRRAYEGTNRRDFSYLPSLIDADCELRLPSQFPGTQTARGPVGFLRALMEVEEAFQDIRYEPQEFLDDGDLVLATVRTTGHARHTGLPIELSLYWLYTFRTEMIVRMEVFLDRTEALEAAELSEVAARDASS